MKTSLKIEKISKLCRKRLERYAKQHGFKKDLEELCAIASATLHNELKKEGIDTIIYGNSFHCFLKVNRKIVDITATQFNTAFEIYPEIYIKNYKDVKTSLWWKNGKKFKTIEDLKRWQHSTEWPPHQYAKII